MVAGHRLMVRGAHHDAHGIGGLQVLGIVGIESPSPHGRPQIVALQTEDKLEDFLVEAVVAEISAEGVLHPGGEAGGLVVEEQSAIAHGGLAVGVFTFLYIDVCMLLNRYICPEIPGRDTYLARQFVDAIDGAALVAAGDDELLADGLDDKFLGLALQVREQALFYPEVDLLVGAHGADEDLGIVAGGGAGACHLFEIGSETGGGTLHATVFVSGIAKGDVVKLPGIIGG